MLIKIIAVGTKMPKWVCEGYAEYADRMPPDYQLKLIEIPSLKRTKNSNLTEIMELESNKLLDAAHSDDYIIALDRLGKEISSQDLAKHLSQSKLESLKISFLIGGPEGLSESSLKKARSIFSLSKLTLPHPLVRVLLAEQLYRAISILNNHPYHR